MNRLLLLLPLVVAIGCESADSSTKSRNSTTPAAGVDPTPRKMEPPPRPQTAGPPEATEQKDKPRPPEVEERKEEPPEKAPPVPGEFKPLNKEKTVFLEAPKEGPRKVHLMGAVCLREGPLEVFLCKLRTKEHESILHIDADAAQIHAALIAAGAKPGNPVKFYPEYAPATGTRIKVSVTFREKGKVKTVPAGEWVKDKTTNKAMAHDWVFAGSRFFKDPEKIRPDYYMANNGEIISLANFPDSMMDLPVKSPKDVADLIFEIDTPKIPPLETPVLVTLEPVVEKKK